MEKKSLTTSLYFLCALHFITADYHLQSVVWHFVFFSIGFACLASCA